jgi:LacI family transcriptional regulator
MGRHGASSRDVAVRAGVSIGTVSNVVNRPNIVSTRTRAKVEAAIQELGFVPNASARRLRGVATRTIGVVVPDVSNPFFTDLARGAEDAANEADFLVIVCNSDESAVKEEHYLNMLEAQQVDGICITPATRTSLQKSPTFRRLMDRGVALAVMDGRLPGVDACFATVDDVRGGALAAEHLLGHGHTSFIWVTGPDSIPQCYDRERGIRSALADLGPQALTRVEVSSMTADAGLAIGHQLVDEGFGQTAIICANDLLAFGCLRAFLERGIRVPDDVSIIGYDDIDFARVAAVPLTSIRQPRRELGRAAAELVLGQCNGLSGAPTREIIFQPALVARESTARRT